MSHRFARAVDWQTIQGFRHRRHPDVAGLVKAKAELLEAFPQLR